MYYSESAIMSTPLACINDLTPPTFSGITALTALTNGALKVEFGSATDASPPINYRVYLKKGQVTAAELFQSTNRHSEYFQSPAVLISEANGDLLTESYYTVGVRALDAVGNESSNLELLSVFTPGVLTLTVAELVTLVRASLRNLCNTTAKVETVELQSLVGAENIKAKVTEVQKLGC